MKMMNKGLAYIRLIISLIATMFLLECNDAPDSLSGIGSTFPQLFYDKVIQNYSRATGVKITYNDNGSGLGIRSLRDCTVDFIVNNVRLSSEEIMKFRSEILQIPCSQEAVVLVYNLPDVSELRLTPETISDIYTGKITCWNDPSIAQLNPTINLPNLQVTPVHHSDNSGTTCLFSDYLYSRVPEWREKMGRGSYLNFGVGIAAAGNPAIVNTVLNVQGAIAYTSSGHAVLADLPEVALQNASGDFVTADEGNDTTYPMRCFSWIIVYKNQAYNHRSMADYEKLKNFLNYLIQPETQHFGGELLHAPLPQSVVDEAQRLINCMEYRK